MTTPQHYRVRPKRRTDLTDLQLQLVYGCNLEEPTRVLVFAVAFHPMQQIRRRLWLTEAIHHGRIW